MENIESIEKNWLLVIICALSRIPANRRKTEEEKETLTSRLKSGYVINKLTVKIIKIKRSVVLLSFLPFHHANACLKRETPLSKSLFSKSIRRLMF
jgi:hypothetical protein